MYKLCYMHVNGVAGKHYCGSIDGFASSPRRLGFSYSITRRFTITYIVPPSAVLTHIGMYCSNPATSFSTTEYFDPGTHALTQIQLSAIIVGRWERKHVRGDLFSKSSVPCLHTSCSDEGKEFVWFVFRGLPRNCMLPRLSLSYPS